MAITYSTFRDIKNPKFDEVWVIVPELKALPRTPTPIYHIPELAPSPEVDYIQRKAILNKEWNETTFQKLYVPAYKQQLEKTNAFGIMRELNLRGTESEILVACRCPKDELCHRDALEPIIRKLKW